MKSNMHNKILFSQPQQSKHLTMATWVVETVLQPTHSKKTVTVTEHKAAMCVPYSQQPQQQQKTNR